jgi:hypothetical protein
MPSIEGSDPATADGEEAQSWGQVPLQRILIGGPPTTTDDLRDRVEPLLRVPQSGRCLGSLPSGSDTARGITRQRRLRDWNDARCSTSSTSCRSSLAAAPRSLPGSARSTCWSWAMRVPYRGAFRTQLRHQAAGYCSRNRARTALGAQALQLARRCVTQGLQGSGAEFAMHHAGYPM